MYDWTAIPGFPGYQVSRLGLVRSSRQGSWRELRGRVQEGYHSVSLCHEDGRPRVCKIHRLVASVFLPSTDDLLEVNHIDGDKSNNQVENLEWVTHSENVAHAWRTGLRKVAERYPCGHKRSGKKLECAPCKKRYDRFKNLKLREYALWVLQSCGIDYKVGTARSTNNWHRAKTHCKQGHEFNPKNTRIKPSGARDCRTCDRITHQLKRDAEAQRKEP